MTAIKPHVWRSAASLNLVERLNEKWLALAKPEFGESARKRAARMPVLLVDLRFQDYEWWDRAARVAGHRAEHPEVPLTSQQHQIVSLIREILMEAHLLIRANATASAFGFDMAPRVAAIIQSLSPTEIDWIANHYVDELTPRWAECATFWDNLTAAAVGANDAALSKVHLHSIQLLGRAG